MSELYEIQRNKKESGLAWVVAIHFPAFEEFAEKNLYYSTAINLELGDGKTYQPLLSMVRGRHQRDRGNDYAEFNLLNADSVSFQDFAEYLDLLEMAEITIKECVLIEDDLWESEQRFFGYILDYTFDDKNKTLNFTCTSDMSREGKPVGSVITRDRCDAEFAYNGSSDPEFELCGWTAAQGGNPIFCTRKLKGKDGCIDHNNSHRFHALNGLINATVTVISSEINPSGFDYNSDSNREYYYQ